MRMHTLRGTHIGKLLAALAATWLIASTVATPASAQRAGNKEIAAHGGDWASIPSGWREDEWENSIQAIVAAFVKAPRWVEIDAQLNRDDGKLYAHHNETCEVINLQGQPRGLTVNLRSDGSHVARLCAERIENLLARFPTHTFRSTRFLIEMKDQGSAEANTLMVDAMYKMLKQRGERTINIVSSMSDSMLLQLRDKGRADRQPPCHPTTGCTLPLMKVFGMFYKPVKTDFDAAKTNGFKYVASNIQTLQKTDVNYAKSIGLYVGAWHWGHLNSGPTNEQANFAANDMDLDIYITDSISDFRTRFPAWK